jgi:hypothetical protein
MESGGPSPDPFSEPVMADGNTFPPAIKSLGTSSECGAPLRWALPGSPREPEESLAGQ